VAPEVNRIAVFNRGTSNALIGTIPIGGHCDPKWKSGESEL